MKIALIVGHNARSEGTYSPFLEKTEFDFWLEVAKEVNKIDDTIDVYCRNPAKNYIQEMKPVIAAINEKNYDYCLELHFNSSDKSSAKGCECLVHKNSEKGKNVALSFLEMLNNEFKIPIRQKQTRGLILVEDSKTRGAYGICKTKPAYVLIEPFFGSNEEAKKFKNVKVIANFLIKFIRGN